MMASLRLLDDEDLASRDAILPWLEQTETVAAELLEKLDGEELARETHLPFWEDENACVTVAEGLLQICNHATDHRAQALAAIHSHGGETTEQDLLIHAFERRGVPWGWAG